MKEIDAWKQNFPQRFLSTDEIFSHIRRGDRIFISTGCGEPQHLIQSLMRYIEAHPKAFAEAEVFHVWTMGVAPYANERFTYNFRHNSFFVSSSSRNAVNQGIADYTPIFLSKLPELFRRGRIPIDIALIQTSDNHIKGTRFNMRNKSTSPVRIINCMKVYKTEKPRRCSDETLRGNRFTFN